MRAPLSRRPATSRSRRHRTCAAALAGLITATLAGCGISERMTGLFSSEDTATPPAELVEFEPRARVVERWRVGVGGTEEHYLKLAPVVVDDRVFAASRDGDLAAHALADGKRLWRVDTDRTITGGPGVGEGLAVIGTKEGRVLAYDVETGEEVWRKRVSSEVLATPAVGAGTVVVHTGDGKLYALEAANGARRWVYDREVPLLSLRGTGPPRIENGTIYVGLDNGRIAALDPATGQSTWELRVALPTGRSDLERIVDIDSELLIDGGTVFAASYQGKVAAISAYEGQIYWTRDISSHAGVALSDRAVFVSDEFGHVWAVERDSGISIWKQDALTARQVSSPGYWNGTAVVADLEGYVHFMDAESGEFIARRQVGDERILVAPVATEAGLLIYSTDGRLSLLDLEPLSP